MRYGAPSMSTGFNEAAGAYPADAAFAAEQRVKVLSLQ